MAYTAKRNPTRCPTHPGALLRDDVIPATGRTKVEIAGLLGLDKLFGDGAGICTRMQAAYVTWHAERKEDVSKIPTIRARAA